MNNVSQHTYTSRDWGRDALALLGRRWALLKKFWGLVDVLDHDYMRTESQKALNRLDIHIPSLRNKIATLSGGQRQAVAISRSIYWDAKLRRGRGQEETS